MNKGVLALIWFVAMATVFVIVQPFLWQLLFPSQALTEQLPGLRDTYVFIVALVSVLAAVIGLGLYATLSGRLTGEAKRAAYVETQMLLAYNLSERSYFLYERYSEQKEKGEIDYATLESAISAAQRANAHCAHLDERERRHEAIICNVKNNLASLLAIRKEDHGNVQKGDGHVAAWCAKYIRDRIWKYPAATRKTWAETIRQAEKAFPECKKLLGTGYYSGDSGGEGGI